MVQGSAALSDHLRPSATKLVRLVARLRTSVTSQEETVPIPLQLMVLDRTWQDFERAYLDAFATPAPVAMTEGLLAYTVQLSETLLHALHAGWADSSEVDRVEPALVVALGRASLFSALRIPPLAEALRALFETDPPATTTTPTTTPTPTTPTTPSAYMQVHQMVAVLSPADAAVVLRAIFVPHAQAIPAAHHALFLQLCNLLEQVSWQRPQVAQGGARAHATLVFHRGSGTRDSDRPSSRLGRARL